MTRFLILSIREPLHFLSFREDTSGAESKCELLAVATNQFLSSLLTDRTPYTPDETLVVGGIASDEEEVEILEFCAWLEERGFSEGELEYEVLDSDNETLLAILDMAWPDGIQTGLSESVALLLNEPQQTEICASRMGFRYFTSVQDLKRYIEKEILDEEILV